MPEETMIGSDRIGEVLLASGCITREQLNVALRRQAQSGGRLGSILLELGYLNTESLLELLGNQSGVPTADLYKLNIEARILNSIPFEKLKEHRVIPIAGGNKSLFVGMVDPNNLDAVNDLEFIAGKTIQPIHVPYAQVSAALQYIEMKGKEENLDGLELKRSTQLKSRSKEALDLGDMLHSLIEENASDLLLSAGVPPCLKKTNEIIRLSQICLTPEDVTKFANELMSDIEKHEFNCSNDVDFGYTFPELGRFRVNIYKQRSSFSLSIRSVLDRIPELETLGLPEWVTDYALKAQGLILITGPTGHGKSTSLAAIVDIINTRRRCNIITIEDPIEYLHQHKLSNVNQREIGKDTKSFHEGLRHIFRQAADVIVIGEMRDVESFSIALQAAETGHLVLSTLHANFSTAAIERIIDVFPHEQQHQIRVQIAENFLLILNQRLVPLRDRKGRVLAYEKLANTPRVKNLIRENKTHQIRSMFLQSCEDFQSLDVSLAKLFIEGKISLEEAVKYCDSEVFLRESIGRGAKTKSKPL